MLDKLGYVSEQGSFQALDATGGYVSSFGLGLPEWNSKIDTPSELPQPKILRSSKSGAIKEDPRRQSGDLSIYLYYIRSIGWLPTVIFLVAISGFVFCISFPSTVSVTLSLVSHADQHDRHLGQMVGKLKRGRPQWPYWILSRNLRNARRCRHALSDHWLLVRKP